MQEVRTALLEADVHLDVVKSFCKDVIDDAVGAEVIQSLKPGQQMIEIVNRRLVDLMGPVDSHLMLVEPGPTIFMMCGLQGSGKTTTCGKLAALLKKRGKRVLVVAADLQRPAAVEQLRITVEGVEASAPGSGEVAFHGEPEKCDEYGKAVGAAVGVCRRGVERGRKEKYDAVIIETTGMADPAPVAYTFNTKAEVGAQYRIDSILCVVDAKHVQQHLDEVRPTGVVNEAVNQVAFADKILLNKIDLVTPEEKAKVRESLASINAMAKVIETQQSRANLDELLGIGSFSLESVSHMLDNVLDEDEPEAQDGHAHTHAHGEGETCNHPSHGHGHAHAHEGGPTSKKPKRSEHLSGVSSVGIIVDGPLDEQKFNGFMVHLIQTKAADLYRCKGVVALQGSDEKHVFHGVHEQIAFAPVDEGWAEGEKRVCKLVFIGRNLDKPALDKAAQACKA